MNPVRVFDSFLTGRVIAHIKNKKKKGRRLMSWIWWTVIVILGINFVMMGSMILWLLWRERTRRR